MVIVEDFWVIRNKTTGYYLNRENKYKWRKDTFTTFHSKDDAIKVLKKLYATSYSIHDILESGEIYKCKRTIELDNPMPAIECYKYPGNTSVHKKIEELSKLSNAEILLMLKNSNPLIRTVAKYILTKRKVSI
jgi:hypothetical protein